MGDDLLLFSEGRCDVVVDVSGGNRRVTQMDFRPDGCIPIESPAGWWFISGDRLLRYDAGAVSDVAGVSRRGPRRLRRHPRRVRDSH